jgi:predicted dithiol-disulfide oxidoreductase (DUF899 family)
MADNSKKANGSRNETGLPKIVTEDVWLLARKEFLIREKEFDHERDSLSEARRKLPMVKVEKEYVFDGPGGTLNLRDLFQGRRQLIIYHFMFDPVTGHSDDPNAGCKHCSFLMDNIAGSLVHLTARETSFAAVSRTPLDKIKAYETRMHWTFPWVSSFKNDFNCDYCVSLDPDKGYSIYNYEKVNMYGEMPGLSVFPRYGDSIFHTYSTYFRGLDMFLSMYHLLDVTPLGR